MKTLQEELAQEVHKAGRLAAKNYYFSFGCLLVALATNGLAVVFVATDFASQATRATLTALPGLLILVNQVFKFDSRSRWWWLKHHKVQALQRELRDQGGNPADVSKALSQVQLESEGNYPTFDSGLLRGGGRPE
jgi:hypothetical protein